MQTLGIKYLDAGEEKKSLATESLDDNKRDFGIVKKELRPTGVRLRAKTLVYLAEYKGKTVAVKIASEEKSDEVAVMKRLQHRHVVEFIGNFEEKDPEGKTRNHIVMEWAEEGDLEVFYNKNKNSFPWRQRLRIALNTAKGLNYLHNLRSPIIHCDLKSPHVGIRYDRSSFILDFGQSKENSPRMEATYNMAPEMLCALESPNFGVDIYGFGIILYELFTNKKPFENLTASEIYQAIKTRTPPEIPLDRYGPEGYSDLMKQCWAKEPTDRPTSEQCVDILTRIYQREAEMGEMGPQRQQALALIPPSELAKPKKYPKTALIPPSELAKPKKYPKTDKSLGFVYQTQYRDVAVAVKVFKVKPDYYPDLIKLENRSIESFLGYSQDEKQFYLVSRYAPCDLQKKITDQNIQLDWPERFQIVLDIISALHCLHSHKIILRYLNPKNILVREDGSIFLSNVFKTAKIMNLSSKERLLDETDPRYWAPEISQPQSEIQTSFFTDIYGLGMILYMLFTRKTPWDKHTEQQIPRMLLAAERPPLPPLPQRSVFEKSLIRLIEDCWSSAPNSRPTLTDVEKRIKDLRKDWAFMGDKEGQIKRESALNKYDFIGKLGSGLLSSVYKVQETATQIFFAMKIVECKRPLAEVKRESEQLFQLRTCHYICELHESFAVEIEQKFLQHKFALETKEHWCLVLPYYQGDLQKQIEEAKSRQTLTGKGWKDDELQIFKWMLQLTEGLTAMHNLSVIHRDLKPGNIFLEENQIRIGDFGIATNETKAYSFVGTMGYYAPEVWKGEGYGAMADMYSLGTVLLDLLTLTFAPDDEKKNRARILKIPNHYSRKWVEVVERLLDDNCTKRYTAADLGTEMRKHRESFFGNSELRASDFETKQSSSSCSNCCSRSWRRIRIFSRLKRQIRILREKCTCCRNVGFREGKQNNWKA